MQHLPTYRINKPAVVAEVINDELVAIQLEDGYYYNSNSVGSQIWNLIESGEDSAAIAAALVGAYAIPRAQADAQVKEFIDILLSEKLIAEEAALSRPAVSSTKLEASHPYEAPLLTKHEDMKELLLLDPIHDIGENAWPLQEVTR